MTFLPIEVGLLRPERTYRVQNREERILDWMRLSSARWPGAVATPAWSVAQAHTAVDGPRLAVDPFRVVGEKECHDVGQVGGHAESGAARSREGVGLELSVVLALLGLAQHEAGHDRVATDPVLAPPRRDVAGERVDACLGGGVSGTG